MSGREVVVGVDVGAVKTMMVLSDGEIVRTITGSISRPSLVSFANKKRVFGEEASAVLSSDSTLGMITQLVGRPLEEIVKLPCFSDRPNFSVSEDEETGVISLTTKHDTEDLTLTTTGLLGSYIAHLQSDLKDTLSRTLSEEELQNLNVKWCFALPPNSGSLVAEAFAQAAVIAGLSRDAIHVFDMADCVHLAYARKAAGLGGGAAMGLEGRATVLADIGHLQTCLVVARFPTAEEVAASVAAGETPAAAAAPRKVAVSCDNNLGAYHFDLILFKHFADQVAATHKTEITLNSKRGARLLAGCERLRKLLSQLPEASITIEHLLEDVDMKFSLRRDELNNLASELEKRFEILFADLMSQLSGTEIAAIEVVGGAVRMPTIQQILLRVLCGANAPLPLGAKFDDGSIALGATLAQQQGLQSLLSTELTDAKGVLSPEALEKARATELELQSSDEAIRELQSAYNHLEAYILDMRSVPRRKFGELVDAAALNSALDESEGWLWDFGQDADLETLNAQLASLTEKTNVICEKFNIAQEEERLRIEKEMAEEMARAAKEREENGEDDDDHDNRRLKKADRMRMVVKNKDEGTELFKGGNFRPAAARYHKALTHAAKFFDLTPDDEKEVTVLKTALYNNLAACYVKMDNWDAVARNCEEAIKLDSKNVKAYFRRATYHENKKDWDAAMADYKTCAELATAEDKLVTRAIDRVKKEMEKEKAKEKKMWGRAFGN